MSDQKTSKRPQWATNVGFVLAAAGSAIGLGNIWKFPGKAYEGGGGAFLLVYLGIVAVVGTTVMLAEFVIGRHTQKDNIGAYAQLRPKWKGWGVLGVVTAFIILCYYFQVGGWVVYYIGSYVFNSASIFADPKLYFYNMLGLNGFPLMGAVICPLIFIGLTVIVIIRGVEKGIENFNKIGMPALLVILIVLMVRAMTLPGAGKGIIYMLTPDFSKMTGETLLVALGQAFFSLSLGMSIMITYGSYLKKEENLAKNTWLICGADTLVAFLAAFMIIPAVFATGVEPGKGGSFAFVALAAVFQKMPAGPLFGVLFYLLLGIAAITSAMSLLEGAAAAVAEQLKWGRKKAALLMALAMFVIGIFYTLSQLYMENLKGIWLDINGIKFPSLGDFMENITDRLLIPINALTACILVGWIWGTKNGVAEVRQNGRFAFRLGGAWSVSVKFIAIAAIVIIIVFGLVFGKAIS